MSLDKRYQIFVSSTFLDLKDERQEVIKAILQLNCLPAGMELFPATDSSAWELIQKVIASSDYYVLVIGGRYGAEDDAGIGFTEKEYDFARSKGLPVLPFLHEDPDSLPRNRTEHSDAAWAKLKAFREKIESHHHRKSWKTPSDLASQVVLGLTHAFSTGPAGGWVRADQVPTTATMSEILKLQEEIAKLKEEANRTRTSPPLGTEDLLQGDDDFEYSVTAFHFSGTLESIVAIGIDDLFGFVAPRLIGEAGEFTVRSEIERALKEVAAEELADLHDIDRQQIGLVELEFGVVGEVILQLRALGLIQLGSKQRVRSDTEIYWALTPYGDHYMTQLLARKRPSVED